MFVPSVPRDIPLPLPAPRPLLETLLIVAFVAHIAFVNLTVGGAILVLGFEVRGLRNRDYDKVARVLADALTVNKSLAVVLGVGPLLLLSVLYTIHFYTANALTGTAWMLVIPAVTAVFLLFYLHKYSWDALATQKKLHIAIQALAVGILLFVPFVFLGNVTLMMYPERWTETHGFLSVLSIPEIFPRYFHFLSASLVLTSLFGVGWFGRAKFPFETTFESLERHRLRRDFYAIALVVSLAQFVVGPVVLATAPSAGLHWTSLTAIILGVVMAIPAVWMMWKEVTAKEETRGRFTLIVAQLGVTVLCMASGRHMIRGIALNEHRRAIAAETARWEEESAQAAYDLQAGRTRAAHGGSEGGEAFAATCAACHGVDRRVVGPPLTEIASLYAGNANGIVTWALAPGKKRPDFPQMPSMAALGEAKLRAIAEYMLETGRKASGR
jgi:cytochrome c